MNKYEVNAFKKCVGSNVLCNKLYNKLYNTIKSVLFPSETILNPYECKLCQLNLLSSAP